jgi:hypothetical protein
MQIQIFKGDTLELLEASVNNFLKGNENSLRVKNISFSVGAFPKAAEFYAMVQYE